MQLQRYTKADDLKPGGRSSVKMLWYWVSYLECLEKNDASVFKTALATLGLSITRLKSQCHQKSY